MAMSLKRLWAPQGGKARWAYVISGEDGEVLFRTESPQEALKRWEELVGQGLSPALWEERTKGTRPEKLLDEGYTKDGTLLRLELRMEALERRMALEDLEGKTLLGLEEGGRRLRFAEGTDLVLVWEKGVRLLGAEGFEAIPPEGVRVVSAEVVLLEKGPFASRGEAEVVLGTEAGTLRLRFEGYSLEDYGRPYPAFYIAERAREMDIDL